MNIVISSRSFNQQSRYLEKLDFKIKKEVNKDTIGIIAGTEQISKDVIDKAPNLKVISRYGAGLDNVDVEYCKQKNITVYTTTAQTLAVAEFTLALILDLLKSITVASASCERVKGHLLTHKTIGIVGYGNIGQEVARLLKPFDVTILKHDIKLRTSTGLQEIFEYSDVVTLHLPLTKETYHIINKPLFAMANKHLILINTARGGIIDEDALQYAIEHKQIAGAALDVSEKDMIEFCYKNVILTDHMASYTYETREEMEEEAVYNLLRGLQ